MKLNNEPIPKKTIIIPHAILNSANISLEEIKSHYDFLTRTLKNEFFGWMPTELNSLSLLQSIVDLSNNLQKLASCKGFEKHIKTYIPEQFGSNSFVSLVAGYFVDKVNSLELEPVLEKTGKNPDIFVKYAQDEVYLECKIIETEQFNFRREHENIANYISKYVNFPHQVTITYKNTLTNNDISTLGTIIAERLPHVTNEGIIFSDKNIEIHISPRVEYGATNFTAIIDMIMVSNYNGLRTPSHTFYKDGRSICISGPEVDYSSIFLKKIRKSRRQADSEKSFILVVNTRLMVGDTSNNLSAISHVFQPELNTRFSGVLLVEYYSVGSKTNLKFIFIRNPFSKNPISKEFESLFKVE